MTLKIEIVPVTPFAQNSSIVMCEQTKEAAIVDPGGEVDRIIAQAESMGAKITKIILTHAHIDHAGGVADLARKLSLPIEGPQEKDQFWISALPQQSQMFGFPNVETFTPDRWLNDGDQVTVGDQVLEVIHTPGHTPGHVVFYHQGSKLAFVGDVIFQGSIGRTDFPQSNHQELIDSIQKKLFPLGDEITFVPGHGPTSTFGQERATNPFVSGRAG